MVLHLVPDGVSGNNLLPAAQFRSCLGGMCSVWGLCYGLRPLGAGLPYGRGSVFCLEGGGVTLSGVLPFFWRSPLFRLLGYFQLSAEDVESVRVPSVRLPGGPIVEDVPSPHRCCVVPLGLFGWGFSLGSCVSVDSGAVGECKLGFVSLCMCSL